MDNQHASLSSVVISTPLDVAISGWLHEKKQRSNSEKTIIAYRDTLTQFRELLQQHGLDLNTLESES